MDKPNIFSDFYLQNQHQVLHCHEPIEAFIQYKSFRIDLLTGKRFDIDVQGFFHKMEEFNMDGSFEKPIVFHLFYEFGYFCQDLEDECDGNIPLGVFIQYDEAYIEQITTVKKEGLEFEPLEHQPFHKYQQKFKKVYEHLLRGDCYQLNLTQPFYFRSKQKINPREFIQSLWGESLKIGAYAHGTFIEGLDTLYFSNSPECLFQISKGKVRTMPIKGTISVESEKERSNDWKQLTSSQKDESELNMITDLMRNDLTKINMNPAKVVHKKYPLHVPGLVHQFSVIQSELKQNVNLKEIVRALFPGGSITGAPKKRVMELTREIENYNRGFYCGSTVLLYKNIKTASINIRSAEFNFERDEIKYGAGGGITLLSKDLAEYQECLDKLKSFLLLFQEKDS